jgi:hypothetical protein
MMWIYDFLSSCLLKDYQEFRVSKAKNLEMKKMSTEWEILTQEVENLHNAGKCDWAISAAKKALNYADKNLGSNHPYEAKSL